MSVHHPPFCGIFGVFTILPVLEAHATPIKCGLDTASSSIFFPHALLKCSFGATPPDRRLFPRTPSHSLSLSALNLLGPPFISTFFQSNPWLFFCFLTSRFFFSSSTFLPPRVSFYLSLFSFLGGELFSLSAKQPFRLFLWGIFFPRSSSLFQGDLNSIPGHFANHQFFFILKTTSHFTLSSVWEFSLFTGNTFFRFFSLSSRTLRGKFPKTHLANSWPLGFLFSFSAPTNKNSGKIFSPEENPQRFVWSTFPRGDDAKKKCVLREERRFFFLSSHTFWGATLQEKISILSTFCEGREIQPQSLSTSHTH